MKAYVRIAEAVGFLTLVVGVLAMTKVFVLFPGFPALSVTVSGAVASIAALGELLWGSIDEAVGILGYSVILMALVVGICRFGLLPNSNTVVYSFMASTFAAAIAAFELTGAMAGVNKTTK
jgi:hypothetical protein